MNSIETELASELYRRCRRFTPRQRDAVKLLSAIGHNVWIGKIDWDSNTEHAPRVELYVGTLDDKGICITRARVSIDQDGYMQQVTS